MSEEGYIQFGIPGVPYSAVQIPIKADSAEMAKDIERAVNLSAYARDKYVAKFGEQKVEAAPQAGPPKCPVHGTPMKPSTSRSGGFFCSKKVGDEYCKERA